MDKQDAKHLLESLFSGAFPEEFDKEGIEEIFDILQIHQRYDLMEKLKHVLEYAKQKVRFFLILKLKLNPFSALILPFDFRI